MFRSHTRGKFQLSFVQLSQCTSQFQKSFAFNDKPSCLHRHPLPIRFRWLPPCLNTINLRRKRHNTCKSNYGGLTKDQTKLRWKELWMSWWTM
ncbi:hypothetical protein RB195_021157 [Necator americanus]|uniref:Uncharacterized protein n=1 Tax=Necator americanus TaxID=51031 RepID=A0ABR1E9L2_NECAM